MNLGKWKKWMIISIVISVASLTIIFMLTATHEAIKLMLSVPILFLILIGVVHTAHWFFWALRIKILACSLGEKISFIWAFKIVMVNLFMASVTPSSFGGEPTRIYMLSRGKLSGGDATALTLGERLIDFIFFGTALPIFLFLLGLSIDVGKLQYYLIGAAIIMGVGGLTVIYIVRHPHKAKKAMKKLEPILRIFFKKKEKISFYLFKMERETESFISSTKVIFKMRWYFTAAFLATMLMWLADFSIPSLILLAMGYPHIWLLSVTFQMIILLITIIPVSPGGSGLAEFSAFFLYSQKLPSDVVSAMIVLWRILTFYLNLVGGLIYTIHYVGKTSGNNGTGKKTMQKLKSKNHLRI